MIQPLRTKSQGRGAVSLPAGIEAPTKGWYVGANLADAPDGTAFLLENVFPQLDYIRLRRGSTTYAKGMGSSVTTLMPYLNGALTKLFAAGGGKIWDVTGGGTVGSPAVSGLQTKLMHSLQFTGTGGQFLMALNGSDPAQIFSGSSWSTSPAITGLDSNGPFAFAWAYKNRIYGVQSNSMNAWYLPLDSIGGAATIFPLTSVFTRGGYLLCGGTWAVVTTNGTYESCVFISSEGEVAIYSGAYPGDSTTWALSGVYKVSRPLGRRCLMKAGGDLAIMTEDGIVPLSKAMQLDQLALQNAAVTLPIAPEWRKSVLTYGNVDGWQLSTWPLESMGIVCLPQNQSPTKTQYVVNARTGAWARYVGWDANCFGVYNNQLFFGTSDGRVCQAEVGGKDDTSPYICTIFQKFTALDKPGLRKQIKMAKPYVQADFSVNLQLTINTEFATTYPASAQNSTAFATSTLWGSAIWGKSIWPGGVKDQSVWMGAPANGVYVAPILQIQINQTSAPDFRYSSIDLLYEPGSPLG